MSLKRENLLTDVEYLELLQLLDTHGTPEKVAEAMDCSVKEINELLDTYQELKRFSGKEVPDVPEDEDPEPLAPILQSDPELVERRLRAVDDRLAPALIQMGLSSQLAQRMVHFRDYGRDRFGDIRQMVGGGTVVNLARLNAIVSAMYDRLDDPAITKEERAMTISQLDVLLEHLHKVSDRAQNAALIEAKVKAASDQADHSKRSRKPGFRPLVAVNAGSVTITENGKPAS